MIRLVATDLDGTIVGSTGQISVRTVAALRAVEDAGLRLVFVTGRPPRWMRDVATATNHRGVAICANGAYVYDLHNERITDQFLMPAEVARRVVASVREVLPNSGFAVERSNGLMHDHNYRSRYDTPAQLIAETIQLLDAPLAKLLIRDETSDGDTMLRVVRPVLAGLADVTHSNVNDCLLEVSAFGVSKATTLAKLADRWGVTPSETIAFGDMPNDVAMLQWAGVGYAVADAHPEVLAVIDHVTASVDNDGVAEVLENLLG